MAEFHVRKLIVDIIAKARGIYDGERDANTIFFEL
jgi:hypothetical protein